MNVNAVRNRAGSNIQRKVKFLPTKSNNSSIDPIGNSQPSSMVKKIEKTSAELSQRSITEVDLNFYSVSRTLYTIFDNRKQVKNNNSHSLKAH